MMGFADRVVEGDPVDAAIRDSCRRDDRQRPARDRRDEGDPRRTSLARGDIEARYDQTLKGWSRESLDSADYREGAAAFMEKRARRGSPGGERLHIDGASFEMPAARAPQDEEFWVMALTWFLILRSAHRGRLEGRTAPAEV